MRARILFMSRLVASSRQGCSERADNAEAHSVERSAEDGQPGLLRDEFRQAPRGLFAKEMAEHGFRLVVAVCSHHDSPASSRFRQRTKMSYRAPPAASSRWPAPFRFFATSTEAE